MSATSRRTRRQTQGFGSTVFHRLNFVMPARNAFVHAFLAVRLIWLNEREPQRLIALRARPEAQGLWRGIPKRFRHRYCLGDSSGTSNPPSRAAAATIHKHRCGAGIAAGQKRSPDYLEGLAGLQVYLGGAIKRPPGFRLRPPCGSSKWGEHRSRPRATSALVVHRTVERRVISSGEPMPRLCAADAPHNSAYSLRLLARLKYSIDVVDRGCPYASPSVLGCFSCRTLGDRLICLPRPLLGSCRGRNELLRKDIQ